MMKPRRSILDRRFKYRNSADTDVRETFRRARRRAALMASVEAKKDADAQKAADANVVPIRKQGGA